MPSRILREGILSSDRVNALSTAAEVFYRRLMSVVDDYGRFDGRPGMLRVSCYPLRVDAVREADLSRWIAECVKAGLLVLYAVDGKPYLEMQDFRQQARAKSKYPPPSEGQLLNICDADKQQMQGDCLAIATQVKTPVHLFGVGGVSEDVKPTASSADKLPPCPYEDIVAIYHEVLPELPRVRLMPDKRKKALQSMWRFVLTKPKSDGSPRATNNGEALAWIRGYFERARDNDFLMGRTPRAGEHANWQCDLDFLLTDKGKAHVIEKTKEARS
jgi:hypothetical protein